MPAYERPRPRRVSSHIYCDVHCDIHPAQPDYFEEGATDCQVKNWRPVYVLSVPGEEL